MVSLSKGNKRVRTLKPKHFSPKFLPKFGREMNNFKDYITVKQAAKILGVNSETLRRWDRSGKLEARRHPISGYRLYRREDLVNLLGSLEKAGNR